MNSNTKKRFLGLSLHFTAMSIVALLVDIGVTPLLPNAANFVFSFSFNGASFIYVRHLVLLDKHLKPLRPFVFTLYNGPKWLH